MSGDRLSEQSTSGEGVLNGKTSSQALGPKEMTFVIQEDIIFRMLQELA